MTTATVHHLPSPTQATPDDDLEQTARNLTEGQWVRVTWRDETGTTGTVEGTLRRPSNLTRTLFIGRGFCLTTHAGLNVDVTSIDTDRRPDLDMDTLSERVALWCDAQLEFENKPVGRFQTGDNTAEANALFEAEDYVRTYLRSVAL